MATLEKEKSIAVNGVRLSYTDTGRGDPVFFIHGFPFNKSAWELQARTLEKKYRVITFDIRGFGRSESGAAPPSIDLFASDLLQLIDALELKKVTVCGLSMGGYILMNALGRSPEKFSAVVLCDTQCIADSEEGREKRFKTIDKINADGLTVFAEGYVQNMLCRASLENRPDLVAQVKEMVTSTRQESVTATLKALAERHETCTSLKQVNVPTLIICGKEDTVTPLSQAELLNNTISGSKLKTIENAGHLSNLEQPEAFNAALEDFLK